MKYYDRQNEKADPTFEDVWKKYLTLQFEHEPIGQRYLRNILMRMKFELSLAVGIILFIPGIMYLNTLIGIFCNIYYYFIFLIILPASICFYLIAEGKKSSMILAEVRKSFVTKFYKEQS